MVYDISTDELEAELERRKREKSESEKPKLITENVDLSGLIMTCQEYIDCLHNDNYCDREDSEHYIYEEALKALYGKSIFDWINKH